MNTPETQFDASEAAEGNQAYPAAPAEPIGAEPGTVPAGDEPMMAAVLVIPEVTPEEKRATADRMLADAALIFPEYEAPSLSLDEVIAAVENTNVHIAHMAVALATPTDDAICYYRNEGQAVQTVMPHDVILDLVDDLIADMHAPIIVKLDAIVITQEPDQTLRIDGLYITTAQTLLDLVGCTLHVHGNSAWPLTLTDENLQVVIEDSDLVVAMIEASQIEFNETQLGTRLSGYDLFAHFADNEPATEGEFTETAIVDGEGSEI